MISLHGTISLRNAGTYKLDVDFTLAEGDCVILVGKNGSGKTTILDLAAGARHFDAGGVTTGNMNLPIGYAVQEPGAGLLPWKTVIENILLPARLHRMTTPSVQAEADRLLKVFALVDRATDYPYKLSGGEKQLVNVIRTLCTPCKVVLLDEVLTSLHHDARQKATQLLSTFIHGKTTLIVTHDPADLVLPHTRCLSITDGRVVETDVSRVAEVLNNAV